MLTFNLKEFITSKSERRLDLTEFHQRISSSLKHLTLMIYILVGVIGILVILVFFDFKRIGFLRRQIEFKDGKITEQMQFLKEKDKVLSITRLDLEKLKKDHYYNRYASLIVDYFYSKGVPIKFSDIKTILEVTDKVVPKMFKDKRFSVLDLRTIAMYESRFNLRRKGHHGEKGPFQIKDIKWALKGIGKPEADIWDTKINCEAACFILNKKYDEHKDFRKAIIGYNGIVYKNGKLRDIYWREFVRVKGLLKDIEKKLR